MLKACGVCYAVRNARLLRDVDVEASAGRFLAIIGPNGAGKSTLLRVLASELKPTSGRVTIDGKDIGRLQPAELAARRAVVPQATHLAFPFTAGEVVGLGHSVPGFAGATRDMSAIVANALADVDLMALAERPYQSLSGGERQRVHFARALCQMAGSPERQGQLLLLDEATSNLDLSHQMLVLAKARQIARDGACVVAVLHDWNLASMYADDMLMLSEGQVAAFGSPADVLTDELLSNVFRCSVKCNMVPPLGVPFVLPQRCSRRTMA